MSSGVIGGTRKSSTLWRVYADHLGDSGDPKDEAKFAAWASRRDDLFIDLLQAMAVALGYTFDRVQLRRGAYTPQGHVDNEFAQKAIQQGMVELLNGSRPLTMRVTEFPSSPELIDAQIKMMTRSSGAYTEDGKLRVIVEEAAAGRKGRA